MERRVSSRFHSPTAFVHAAACIVSLVMLLSFPASSVHSFGTHFRTPEVRRALERHTSVAHSDGNTPELIAHNDLLPTFFTPAETGSKIFPTDNSEPSSDVPLSSLLNRRKLSPSGSGGPDPLIQA
jgi:hypothetical protein